MVLAPLDRDRQNQGYRTTGGMAGRMESYQGQWARAGRDTGHAPDNGPRSGWIRTGATQPAPDYQLAPSVKPEDATGGTEEDQRKRRFKLDA